LRLALRVDGARTLVDRDAFVLGRSADANLVLRDASVSRQHAIIERVGTVWVIVDMASTNGVVVNGTRVARAVLRPGDVIRIGPFAVHVERATPSSAGNPA
jgi:pSer/pThr/pTyr-binding forkhead associated (FHA) protein